MNTHQTKEKTEFVLVREFNAPKKLVFNAFSNAEALNEWWGPVQTKNSVIKLDFRPGGIFHYKMESTAGTNYARMLFGEIDPYDLLEFTIAFTDENAKIVKAPFPITFPLEVAYRLEFKEKNGKTTITLRGEPLNARPEEIEGFRSLNKSMEEGFGKSFDKLVEYLNEK